MFKNASVVPGLPEIYYFIVGLTPIPWLLVVVTQHWLRWYSNAWFGEPYIGQSIGCCFLQTNSHWIARSYQISIWIQELKLVFNTWFVQSVDCFYVWKTTQRLDCRSILLCQPNIKMTNKSSSSENRPVLRLLILKALWFQTASSLPTTILWFPPILRCVSGPVNPTVKSAAQMEWDVRCIAGQKVTNKQGASHHSL